MRQMRSSRSSFSALVLAAAVILLVPAGAMGARADSDRPSPQRIVIGLDLSKSNPLVTSRQYAASVAQYVSEMVKALPLASSVMLRTFGTYEGDRNTLRVDRSISSLPDEKPAAVAKLVREIIANVPKLVRNGTLDAQNSTNILAFLDNMSDVVDCTEMSTNIVLISDGMEDSEYAKLSNPKDHLPRPTSRIYKNCGELQILGLGRGQRSPAATQRIRREWENWARAAGFRSFVGLNSW